MNTPSSSPSGAQQPAPAKPCACQSARPLQPFNLRPTVTRPPVNRLRYALAALLALSVWLAAYTAIAPLAHWLTFGLAGLDEGAPAGAALEFFLYDTAKILLLLCLMVYVIAWLRAGLRTERVRDALRGRGRGIGYVLGAGFGAITPFCSCSSIPLFIAFTSARIPLGVTMAFLITSPLINEIAVVLLWGLLGWKFTLIYLAVGLLSGIVGGAIMDALRAERWLQPFLLDAASKPGPRELTLHHTPDLLERHAFALAETQQIFRRVWRWVIIGVGLGALLHGFVPEAWITSTLGQGQWWSVPLAVAVGIPLYTNVTGIVPVMESLLLKGLPLGTTLAFCMSTVAASLPEVLMLKQVMRWKLLALFLGLLLILFTLVGWLFNALQVQL